jgi:Dna[CI] antecedent, DciA
MRETMPKKPPHDKKRSPDLHSGRAYVRRTRGPAAVPRSLGDIIGAQGLLQRLAGARSAQQDWLGWLRQQLPAELQEAAVNVIPKGRELVVMTSNAAWSARLRYALAALEPQINARDPQVSKVSVRIAPLSR